MIEGKTKNSWGASSSSHLISVTSFLHPFFCSPSLIYPSFFFTWRDYNFLLIPGFHLFCNSLSFPALTEELKWLAEQSVNSKCINWIVECSNFNQKWRELYPTHLKHISWDLKILDLTLGFRDLYFFRHFINDSSTTNTQQLSVEPIPRPRPNNPL